MPTLTTKGPVRIKGSVKSVPKGWLDSPKADQEAVASMLVLILQADDGLAMRRSHDLKQLHQRLRG